MPTAEATLRRRPVTIATDPSAPVSTWSHIRAIKPSAPVAILLALPLVLLLLDRNWPYATLVHDPWVYLGHALDPWDMLVKVNGDYHSRFYYTSRLGIILPLAAAHAVLPAFAANLLVRLVLFEVSVLCIFGVLARSIGHKTGLLVAFVLGTNFFFLDAVARDYSDGFGIAYFLAAIWGASQGGRSWRGFVAMACGGASTVALVSVNLTYLTLLPFPLACYAMTRARDRSGAGRALDLVALTVGAIGLFVCFCLFYRVATGDFWFLGPSIAFLRSHQKSFSRWTYNGATLFKFGDFAWIGSAVWLALPVAVGTLSVVVLPYRWARGSDKSRRRSDLWMLLYLGQCCLFLVLDSCTATAILLQAWYYASMLIPLMSLALGALIGPGIESLGERSYRMCFGLAAFFLLAEVGLPVAHASPTNGTHHALVWAVTPALLALVLLLFRRGERQFLRGVTVVAATALLAGSTYASRAGFREEASLPYYGLPVTSDKISELLAPKHLPPFVQRMHRYDRDRADFYLSIVDGFRYAESFDTSNNLLFWFDMADPHAMIYDNLACCRNWTVSMVNFSFPGLNSDQMSTAMTGIVPGSLIAILSTDAHAGGNGRKALAAVGLGSRLLGQKAIKHGKIRFTAHMIRVIAKEGAS